LWVGKYFIADENIYTTLIKIQITAVNG
jgi:hypothetical protein